MNECILPGFIPWTTNKEEWTEFVKLFDNERCRAAWRMLIAADEGRRILADQAIADVEPIEQMDNKESQP